MLQGFLHASFILLASASVRARDSVDFSSLDAYGTLAAGGVVATIDGDANRNATAALEWRLHGSPAYRAGHALIRVDATHLVGSLFWLDAGRAYDVRVNISDPDGTDAMAIRETSLTTRGEAGAFVPLRTLYISPTGSDANDGSAPASALRTIQRGADLARPGDLVLIGSGIYREEVRVTSAGSASQPIVLRGAPGAVLDGADAAIEAGVDWNDTGGVWSRATGFATAHVVSDQGRLFRYATLADLRTLDAGAPGGFVFDGTTLSLRFSDGLAPAQHQIHVARFDQGITLDGAAHVRIENLEIRHYGSDQYGKGIYLRYASDNAVSGNNIHDIGAAGIWLKGGERNLFEYNNIGDSSIAGWPWSLVHGSSAENSAITFTDDVGRGNVIRRNDIHGTFDGLQPCASAAPPNAFSSETDVYENTIADIADDAIEAEGSCANIRLWNNRISDSLMAFAIAPARVGPVWILRNTAWNLGNTHSALVDGQVSSAIKINSGDPAPVGPTLVYHNTFLTSVADTDALVLMTPGFSTRLTSRNNLYAGPGHALRKDSTIPVDFDYDDLHAGGPSLVRWYATDFPTLLSLQAGVGQEPHGLCAPPALADAAHGNFTPLPGSALIDRGLAIAGIDDGFAGAAPDIGAVERDEAVFADGFE